MTDIQRLNSIAKSLELPYSDAGMVEVDAEKFVSGLAFYPVGRGVFEEVDGGISGKKIMVAGQDFGTLEYLEKEVLPNQEEKVGKNPTWKNLKVLLDESGVSMGNCFFTNTILGVREKGKMTGVSPGFECKPFREKCRQFFVEQLKIQRPELVLLLGFQPVEFLKEKFSTQLTQVWAGVKTITDLVKDEKLAVVKNVSVDEIAGWRTSFVVIFHPSFRPVNVSKLSNSENSYHLETDKIRIKSILNR